MKRSGFKRLHIERKPQPLYRAEGFRPAAQVGDEVRQVLKAEPVRSEAYRRLVAAMPCVMCGRMGLSQAAHPNTGKGTGTKADDRLCFPLCADRPGAKGCHSRFDQGAIMDKDTRRAFEEREARLTQQRILAARQWPQGLPRYDWGDT